MLKLINTDCCPLVIDYDYEITDKELLAEYAGELVLGHYIHILKIINSLSSSASIPSNQIIDFGIEKLKNSVIFHRDGWLFQMISWIVLVHRNNGKNYYTQHPHFAPAQHGFDGLSIVLKSDNTIDRIIISEDKCTDNPRDMIRDEVFQEFKALEEGKKDSALIGLISSLISHLDVGKVFKMISIILN